MSRQRSVAARMLGVAAGSLTLVVVWAAAAGAATDPTTAPTTVPAGATSSLSSGQAFSAAIWALIFGVLGILFVLFFLSRDRVRSFAAMLQLSQRGPVKPDDQPALGQADGGAGGVNALAAVVGGGAPPLQIVGPSTVTVGQQVTFLAVGAPDGQVPAWSVQGDATLSSNSGPSTRLTAQAVGAIYLTVTAGDAHVAMAISAIAATTDQSSSVPFLGSGYGSVVIALAVASVTASLGLTNVINGQAVAGILGSLVTYSVTRAAAAANGAGGGAGGGGQAGGANAGG
jgi:hypothetical protein